MPGVMGVSGLSNDEPDAYEEEQSIDLRDRALGLMQQAEGILADPELGEMERQIRQAALMERACNLLHRRAILTGDEKSAKEYGSQAIQWAGAQRAATSKRKNDLMPLVIKAIYQQGVESEQLKKLKVVYAGAMEGGSGP